MIRDLKDDEQVVEPGAYRTSMKNYHGQSICPGVSVSSTGIRKAALASPLAFWKTSDLNPDRYPPKEESDALILGKAAHCLILGDEVVADNFAYVPEGAPKRPTVTQVAAFEKNGFWSDAAKAFLHPNVVVFLTPEGRVARYIYGTRMDARTVELAITDADWERISNSTAVFDMLTGACFSYNYAEGRYQWNYSLLAGVGSLVTGLSLMLLGAWTYRRRMARRGSGMLGNEGETHA